MAEKETTDEAICVGVRLRPFVDYEKGQKQCIRISGKTVSLDTQVLAEAGRDASQISKKDFQFDQAMDSMDPSSPSFCSQEKCYSLMVERMVGHVFQGYNTCLFCYGQTGTGKTTTIMGKTEPAHEQGVLLRLLHDVFDESDRRISTEGSTIHIKVQMLEVYNEKIKDLLLLHGQQAKQEGVRPPQPDVHVHPKLGVYLKDVREEPVESVSKCLRLIDYGNTMKTVAATAMNAKSSRAHTIFKLNMEKKGGSDKLTVMSEVFFVDLAGRENEKTTKVTGDRLTELTFINKSLMFLSQCIQSLGDSAKKKTRKSVAACVMARKSIAPHGEGPGHSGGTSMSKFRNSKLTLLLSNALSGNSKTSMIGTLSPAMQNFEESFSTLKFADTVKCIQVDAKPASAVCKEMLVTELQEEVRLLKEQLEAAQAEKKDSDMQPGTRDRYESDALIEKIQVAESMGKKFAQKWEDDWQQSEKLMKEREKAMVKLGGVRWKAAEFRDRSLSLKTTDVLEVLENPLPFLANFCDDPHLSGRLTLHPKKVGKEYSVGYGEDCHFLVPHGLGMTKTACYLRRDHGRLFLRASGSSGGCVEVNGTKVSNEWSELMHQDCVVLGRSLMFYAFTRPDGGVRSLPANKQMMPGQKEGSESTETLLTEVVGSARAGDDVQLHLARTYYSQLQNQNLDAEGATSLHNFLLQARQAMKMVEEANIITASVKTDCNLAFELSSMAPVLAMGFGTSCFPEFCVRLVRHLPQEVVVKAVTMEKNRRRSVYATEDMLTKFVNDGSSFSVEPENLKTEVVHTWHFPKFTNRFQLMQDVYQAWTQDPDSFVLDAYNDPWSEYGLEEIQELQQEHQDKLQRTRDEVLRLREENHIVRRSTGSLTATVDTMALSYSSARVNAELERLREDYKELEAANAALRSELVKVQAEASNALRCLAENGLSSGSFRSSSSPRRSEENNTPRQQRSSKRDRQGSASRSETPTRRSQDGSSDVCRISEKDVSSPIWRVSEDPSRAPSSSQAKSCLELSRANLSLVEDLFRLSVALLRASSSSLQHRDADRSTNPPHVRAEQHKLADAASNLVSLLTGQKIRSKSRSRETSPMPRQTPDLSSYLASMPNNGYRTESASSALMQTAAAAAGLSNGFGVVDAINGYSSARRGPSRGTSCTASAAVPMPQPEGQVASPVVSNGHHVISKSIQQYVRPPPMQAQTSMSPSRMRQMLSSPRVANFS